MKFLINNAIKALIPFREYYQGLVKLHVFLVGGVPIWGKRGSPKEGIFFEEKKITYEEAFQNLLKSYLFFRGSLESIKVKSFWEATNVGKDQFLESGGGRGGTCMRESYGNWWIYLCGHWSMPDWTLSQNCRNALPLHVVDQLVRSEANISTAGGRLVGMVMRGDF